MRLQEMTILRPEAPASSSAWRWLSFTVSAAVVLCATTVQAGDGNDGRPASAPGGHCRPSSDGKPTVEASRAELAIDLLKEAASCSSADEQHAQLLVHRAIQLVDPATLEPRQRARVLGYFARAQLAVGSVDAADAANADAVKAFLEDKVVSEPLLAMLDINASQIETIRQEQNRHDAALRQQESRLALYDKAGPDFESMLPLVLFNAANEAVNAGNYEHACAHFTRLRNLASAAATRGTTIAPVTDRWMRSVAARLQGHDCP